MSIKYTTVVATVHLTGANHQALWRAIDALQLTGVGELVLPGPTFHVLFSVADMVKALRRLAATGQIPGDVVPRFIECTRV